MLRWLVLDLNSFFASCEQQEHPELRDRPLIVVQTMAETTCAIAASYPAKALGIKTGTQHVVHSSDIGGYVHSSLFGAVATSSRVRDA